MFKGNLPQLVAVVTGTISAVSDGMQYGWTAPTIPLLESEETPVIITESDGVWLENIYMIGGIAGLPVTIFFVDRIGRKRTIIIACITNLLAWIMIGLANSTLWLYIARFLTGLAGDVNFVAAPMYVAEIADQNIRGFLAGIIYLMMLFGILVIYSIGPFVPIYASAIVGGSLLVFELLTFPFVPESPYFLLAVGRKEDARKSLEWLRSGNDIVDELEDITTAVERQRNEQKGRPQDLILIKSNRRALIIMTVLNMAQHFSSISVILMNLHVILEAAGSIYVSSNTAAIIFAVVMLIAAASASFVLDKFGRKIPLILSSILTGCSLLVIAIYFAMKYSGHDMSSVSWIPIVSIMIYAAVFKLGLGLVPIVMTAELFPAKVKAMGMTLSDAAYLLFAIVSIQTYQTLSDLYGMHVPFFIFAASCFLTAIFCAYAVPETKGKTLDEIQFILKGSNKSSDAATIH